MTSDKDFKQIVRARMSETGETYTAARAAFLPAPPAAAARPAPAVPPTPDAWRRAEEEHARVVGRYVRDGRLTQFPARRKARVSVLLHLVALFAPGATYREPEVNEILGGVVDDHATWRRELVDYGYLERAGGVYRLAPRVPQRPAHMAQEIPAWERLWLQRHLEGRGAAPRRLHP